MKQPRPYVTSTLFYWTAIITVRAAFANIGDAVHDGEIAFDCAGLCTMMPLQGECSVAQ